MNVLLLASHGIAEYDDVRMFSRLGYDVFCPGGYSEPTKPGETLRPAIPEAPDHPELRALCDEQREKHAGEDARYAIDWAKADLHPDLIDWADVIIAHHFVDRWLYLQWAQIKHKRVIWRTCGQSNAELERQMSTLRGLQIVRYSPAERRYFGSIGAFAGEDALIRFGKFPEDYGPWIPTGTAQFAERMSADQRHEYGKFVGPYIANVTQHMVERGEAVGLSFYEDATRGLPAKPAGPGSEQLPGGIGALPYDEMREYLRRARAYLYTGTTPASYTLGLIEAMLSGVPVVSIGPGAWAGPDALFEGHEIVGFAASTPDGARTLLNSTLNEPDVARLRSERGRQRAVDLFGMDTIGPRWQAFLGAARVDKATQTSPWDAVL
jgi:hypothetical protein